MGIADELSKLAEECKRAKERLLSTELTRSSDSVASVVKTFRRSRTDRWFGGVCGGIARSTGIEA